MAIKKSAAPKKTIRCFEFVDEKSSKFWEISVVANVVDVRYGKIGTAGQQQAKEMKDVAAAEKHAEKIIAEKVKTGYIEKTTEVVQASKAKAKSSSSLTKAPVKPVVIEAVKKLQLDKKNVLIGTYGKTLDLRDVELEVDILVNDIDDFARAEKAKRPPPSPIYICGNTEVEVLHLPLDRAMVDYVVIENLPNLREIIISGDNSYGVRSGDLKWLICQNLPKLTKITAKGRLFWLQIEDAPMLEAIDVKKCPYLDYFSILGAPKLSKVNVAGCYKLKTIEGLSVDAQGILDVHQQICTNQEKSKRDGTIYKNMTCTDVDIVLNYINNGLKLAVERQYLIDYSSGYSVVEANELFCAYGFNLLRPLEGCTTGGTGQTYAYEANLDAWGMGNTSQEECLNYILGTISNVFEFEIPGESCATEKEKFALLKKLVAESEKSGASRAKKEKKINFDKLDGSGISKLLIRKPDLFLECDLGKLDGDDWAILLEAQPQLIDHCHLSKLNGEQWCSLLKVHPHLADQCDFKKLKSFDWYCLLVVQPQLADRCNLKKLKDSDLSMLIKSQPQLAHNCDVTKLDNNAWVKVLCYQPTFADKCDFTKFNGENWVHLLWGVPEFSDQCDFTKLNGDDWVGLLQEKPNFHTQCDFSKLNGMNWVDLLVHQPQFSDICDFHSLDTKDWDRLIRVCDDPSLDAKQFNDFIGKKAYFISQRDLLNKL